MVYALVIPLAFITVWSLALFNPHKIHVTILGFAISMFLTLFVTDVRHVTCARVAPQLTIERS